MIATVEGLTFDLDLGEMIDVGLYLQEFEPDMVKAIERYCRPGDTVLDIGANIGAHTLRFARAVGQSGRVYAFEPTDFAYAKLVRNLSLNAFENVKALRIALSDATRPQEPISCRSSWRSDGVVEVSRTTVDFWRLDDWCRESAVPRVQIVKLDVDGAEAAVLRGGQELVSRSRPILLIEVGAWHFRSQDDNPLQLLEKLGYEFRETRNGTVFHELTHIRALLPQRDDAMDFSINIIATPRPVTAAGAA